MEATIFIRPHGKKEKTDIKNIYKRDEDFLTSNNIKVSMEDMEDGNYTIYFDYGKVLDGEPVEHIEVSSGRSCVDTIATAVTKLRTIIMLESASKSLAEYDLKLYDEVELHLLPYRDDRVSCFQGLDVIKGYILDITKPKRTDGIAFPLVVKKPKRKTHMPMNQHLNWELHHKGKIILSHSAEEVIIDGKYTQDDIERITKKQVKQREEYW